MSQIDATKYSNNPGKKAWSTPISTKHSWNDKFNANLHYI